MLKTRVLIQTTSVLPPYVGCEKGRWFMDTYYKLSRFEQSNTIYSLSSSGHDNRNARDITKPKGIGFQ